MKKVIYSLLFSAITLSMASCSDDNSPELPNPDFPKVSNGVYVLNQGNYYSNVEGSLTVIDYDMSSSREKVFMTANGRSLGNTPQCGVAYGSKIYLGIYGSSTIEIIDRETFISEKQIRLDGSETPGTEPRDIVATGGKLYISMFNGYVARLDTLSQSIDATVQVGPNPETMALRNGHLYVPNSDGMSMTGFGTTASEIDLASFTVSRTFTVPQNPVKFMNTSNGLFLLCNGNYSDESAALYKVNDDFSTTKVCDATMAEVCGDKICIVNDPFYGSGVADYLQYDLLTGTLGDWTIQRPEYATDIFYDTITGNTVISSLVMDGIYPSYILPGYVNVYDASGAFVRKYNAGSGPAFIFGNAE